MMSAVRRVLAMALLLASLPLWAAAPAAPVPLPDDQLLEFLADWQGADGQWVDPMTFASIDPAKVAAGKTKIPQKPPAPATRANPATRPVSDAGRVL